MALFSLLEIDDAIITKFIELMNWFSYFESEKRILFSAGLKSHFCDPKKVVFMDLIDKVSYGKHFQLS